MSDRGVPTRGTLPLVLAAAVLSTALVPGAVAAWRETAPPRTDVSGSKNGGYAHFGVGGNRDDPSTTAVRETPHDRRENASYVTIEQEIDVITYASADIEKLKVKIKRTKKTTLYVENSTVYTDGNVTFVHVDQDVDVITNSTGDLGKLKVKVKGPKKTRVVLRNSTVVRAESSPEASGESFRALGGGVRSSEGGFVSGMTAGVVLAGAAVLSRNFV